MTKYTTLNKQETSKGKETVFTKCVMSDDVTKATAQPSEFDNVLFLGNDYSYGDVFKAWNNGEENDYCLYFGTKGDEFDD